MKGKPLKSYPKKVFYLQYNLSEKEVNRLKKEGSIAIAQSELHIIFDEEALKPYLKKSVT